MRSNWGWPGLRADSRHLAFGGPPSSAACCSGSRAAATSSPSSSHSDAARPQPYLLYQGARCSAPMTSGSGPSDSDRLRLPAFLACVGCCASISSHDFTIFAWYRIAFGLVVLATLAVGLGLVDWTGSVSRNPPCTFTVSSGRSRTRRRRWARAPARIGRPASSARNCRRHRAGRSPPATGSSRATPSRRWSAPRWAITATWIAGNLRPPGAVLVNPPWSHLSLRNTSAQRWLYTRRRRFEFPRHVRAVARDQVPVLADPARYWLLAGEGRRDARLSRRRAPLCR